MNRSSDRRDELLGKIIDVFLDEGISDLSLRPLAGSVGTSARLLIYHFGSKEELLFLALQMIRRRIEASLYECASKERPDSLADFLRMFWRWAVEDSHQRYFRLLFEMNGLAMHQRDKFPDEFWGGSGLVSWIHLFEREFDQLSESKEGRGASTFVMAALNGLLRDLIVTQDLKRTSDGMDYLIKTLSAKPTHKATDRRKRGKDA